MTLQSRPATPLSRLVLFLVCLSAAGGIIAGIHYFAIDLPEQMEPIEIIPDNIVPPYNPCCIAQNTTCFSNCTADDTGCMRECQVRYKSCLRTGC